MKHNKEDIFYYLTVWFATSIIVLWTIGIIFKIITKII
jgi:E3 ubiquitin-protein ligase DOA10